MSTRNSDLLHRPVLWVVLGGISALIAFCIRARALQAFGALPSRWRWAVVDFASDAPQPAGVIDDGDVGRAVAFHPEEMASLQRVSWNSTDVAERIESGDPDFVWLRDLVPAAVLRAHAGGEAMQIPSLARAAAAYSVTADGTQSWLATLTTSLEDLSPHGIARHSTVQAGVPPTAIDDGKTTVVIIAGGGGGCGRGLMVMVAATIAQLAKRLGQVDTHGCVVTGPYRPLDGQERRKSALTASLLMDIERVMMPHSRVSFPIGPHDHVDVSGRLFESVQLFDATGRFRHNERATAEATADSLFFQFATRPGYQMAKSRANVRFQSRLNQMDA